MIMTSERTAYDQLTGKQRLFVDRYVVCLNGAQAAREAGYSVKIARSIASENLTKQNIRLAIDERMKEARGGNLTPETLRQKTALLVNDNTLRPDTKIKAIELAGKMTPGTFEPVLQPATTINFFTVLAKLNALAAPQLSSPGTSATPAIYREATSTHVPPPTSPTERPTLSVESVPLTSSPSDEVVTPQGGAIDIDTPTQKNMVQNS